MIQRTASAQATQGRPRTTERRQAYVEYAPSRATAASEAFMTAIGSSARRRQQVDDPPEVLESRRIPQRRDGAVEGIHALAHPDREHAGPRLGQEVGEHDGVPMGVPGAQRSVVVEGKQHERAREANRDPAQHLPGLRGRVGPRPEGERTREPGEGGRRAREPQGLRRATTAASPGLRQGRPARAIDTQRPAARARRSARAPGRGRWSPRAKETIGTTSAAREDSRPRGPGFPQKRKKACQSHAPAAASPRRNEPDAIPAHCAGPVAGLWQGHRRRGVTD